MSRFVVGVTVTVWKIELSELVLVEGPEAAAWRRYFADRESEFRPSCAESTTAQSEPTVPATTKESER